MRTLSQIKSLLNKMGTNEIIRSLGFSLGPSRSWYYRIRGDFIDILFIQRIASGMAFRIHAYTTIPELVPEYNFVTFPDNFSEHLGNIFDKYVDPDGIVRSYYGWDVNTDEEIEDTFKTLNKVFSMKIDPWFNNINTRSILRSHISANVLEGPASKKFEHALGNT